MTKEMPILTPEQAARKAWVSTLAKAPPARLATLWDALEIQPDHSFLRAPEVGTTMVRGRAGGTGAPFNLGEMTVTRCAVTLASGTVGHAYVQGRDMAHATRAALIDALMVEGGAPAARIEADLLAILRAEAASKRQAQAERAAATKVDFFTMVRGED